MAGITQIKPPIAFHRRDGMTAVLRDAQQLAEWLDRLYDAILESGGESGERKWSARSNLLAEIETVMFELAKEADEDVIALSDDLRIRCVKLIARYREVVPICEPAFARTPTAQVRAVH